MTYTLVHLNEELARHEINNTARKCDKIMEKIAKIKEDVSKIETKSSTRAFGKLEDKILAKSTELKEKSKEIEDNMLEKATKIIKIIEEYVSDVIDTTTKKCP